MHVHKVMSWRHERHAHEEKAQSSGELQIRACPGGQTCTSRASRVRVHGGLALQGLGQRGVDVVRPRAVVARVAFAQAAAGGLRRTSAALPFLSGTPDPRARGARRVGFCARRGRRRRAGLAGARSVPCFARVLCRCRRRLYKAGSQSPKMDRMIATDTDADDDEDKRTGTRTDVDIEI